MSQRAQARVLAINVSAVRTVTFRGRQVTTGFFKKSVVGRVRLGSLGLAGDGQADRSAHGGSDMALYAYPQEHARFWERVVGRHLASGSFGENLTIEGMLESDIRVGDVFRLGGAVLQVTQPRIPCFKLTMAMDDGDDFAARFLRERRLGWYFRVLVEGDIGTGDCFELMSSDAASPSMADYIDAYQFSGNPTTLRHSMRARDLPIKHRAQLRKRLFRQLQIEHSSSWVGWQSLHVTSIVQECDGVRSFHLSAETGQAINALPGQFLTISTGGLTRAYSVSGRSGEGVRISVRRQGEDPSRSMSAFLHDRVSVGHALLARSPAGSFVADPMAEDDLLLVAGGIGVTPFLPMMHLVARQQSRRVVLVLSVASPAELPFKEELHALSVSTAGVRILLAYTGADANVEPTDHHGRIDESLLGKALSNIGLTRSCYICGSEAFNQHMFAMLLRLGVEASSIFVEQFLKTKVALPNEGPQPKVVFQRSGFEVDWDPSAGSLLDLAESHGLAPAFGCRAGTCETCSVALKSGNVAYTEMVEPPEGEVLPCCAYPTSDVSIDL